MKAVVQRVTEASVVVDGEPVVATGGTVVEPPYAWADTAYVADVERLEPFGGYWVHNLTGRDVVLQIPPREAAAAARPAARRHCRGVFERARVLAGRRQCGQRPDAQSHSMSCRGWPCP